MYGVKKVALLFWIEKKTIPEGVRIVAVKKDARRSF